MADRDKARGIDEQIEVRPLRPGGPSMKVPGEGGVKRQPQLPGDRGERSAVHHADIMSPRGGTADDYDRD